MASNKLLHYNTEQVFKQHIANNLIPNESIAFCKQSSDIYTHGHLYSHYNEYKDGNYNMNNCIVPGIYYNCKTGRPADTSPLDTYTLRCSIIGSVGVIGKGTAYLVEQIATCQSNDKVYRRILTVNNLYTDNFNNGEDVTYTDWKQWNFTKEEIEQSN